MLIDGKAIAAEVRAEVRAAVEARVANGQRRPGLRVLLAGDDPASISYVTGKQRAADEVGIDAETVRLPASISERELLDLIEILNHDAAIDGILVQLPLPRQVRADAVIDALDPDKDVDAFHPVNVGRLVLGREGFAPCTPAGIIELLRRSGIETAGRRAVVLGRSHIVGTPMANLLIQEGVDATVTICHSRTRDLASVTREGDILIAAIGRAGFVTSDMVREGAAVIDVGINRVDDLTTERGYRLVGDVDFEPVSRKAGWITPVPGGVGPMTIAMLLRNTLVSSERREGDRAS
jgi:methylenetetrahydrofolate dehydrogenase (NADP+)/methenyltetrahydrofolate cyclohydrolase